MKIQIVPNTLKCVKGFDRFEQLYIISSLFKMEEKVEVYPMVFALTVNRDHRTYIRLFQFLSDQYDSLFAPEQPHPPLKPDLIYSDMECAFLQAIRIFYPNSISKICLVHSQNAWDKLLIRLFGVNYKLQPKLKMILYYFIGSGIFLKELFHRYYTYKTI